MQTKNYFGIPLERENIYSYNNGVPYLSNFLRFNGMPYQCIYEFYTSDMDHLGEYEEALKEFLIYFVMAPLFDIPENIKEKFNQQYKKLSPAQMILDLMEFVDPFEM